MSKHTTVREPLFHVIKRSDMPLWKAWLIRIVSIILGLVIASLLCSLVSGKSPLLVPLSMLDGCFGSSVAIWVFLRDGALLLGVSLALVPAFKMKFWNLGGNGQILVGCLATTICMYYLGDKMPNWIVNILMIVSAIVAGALWAVIPAIFKACFKTNETLFTLMMNYVASGLVEFFIVLWRPKSGALNPLDRGHLPVIGNNYLLAIIVVAVLVVAVTIYFKFSKHGYEVTVVGESENTAKYIGINVKKVVIRTLILSGAICGIIGLLLSGAINYTVSSGMNANMGFTAIMTAWLGKFNPLVIILTSYFVMFLSKGMQDVRMVLGFTDDSLSSIVTGIIYFLIIACEFFISYKMIFRGKKSAKKEGK